MLAGTTIFTSFDESEPPTSVKFTPGAGVFDRVWKSPGIVKFELLPTVGGLVTSPLRLIDEVPALRSISLVVDIWLRVRDVELRNDREAGMGVPAGTAANRSWKYLVFNMLT